MNDSQTPDPMVQAVFRYCSDPKPAVLKITRLQLYSLVSTVQLACRHPQFLGPTREIVEEWARFVGGQISANDPQLRLAIEMGWQPAFDDKPKLILPPERPQ